MHPHALWAVQCTSHVSEAGAKLSWQVKPHLWPHLPKQHNCILADGRRTSPQTACNIQPIQGVLCQSTNRLASM